LFWSYCLFFILTLWSFEKLPFIIFHTYFFFRQCTSISMKTNNLKVNIISLCGIWWTLYRQTAFLCPKPGTVYRSLPKPIQRASPCSTGSLVEQSALVMLAISLSLYTVSYLEYKNSSHLLQYGLDNSDL